MKRVPFLLMFLCVVAQNFAQTSPSSANAVVAALEQKDKMVASSWLSQMELENIGPSVMSGRVVDVAVNPNNPIEFYVAYASGGLWYTQNNGTSFRPIMDKAPTQNLGDIAVDWTNNTIWAGTGENNSSRSSYAGIGILRSDDGGENWKNTGLVDSHHIGRILLDPQDSNTVLVAAMGHLYSPNDERGIYKTKDGGKTWKRTLFVDAGTGAIDLVQEPGNFKVLYASMWERERKAWNFVGNGKGSAIYKSTDAGETWTKISTPESGFPTGEGVGRIGLAVYNDQIVYALLDNQYRRDKEEAEEADRDDEDLTRDDFKEMSVNTFLTLDDAKLNAFLKSNGFHEKYRAPNVKQMVRVGTVKPEDLAKYLEDANALLFDTPVIGAEVYKSVDGGRTWKKQNDGGLDNLYYSYGYYFGEIRVSPTNPNKIYLGGVPIIKSEDGGKTFVSINGDNVHVDHHALWINPNNPRHMVNGNDGGVNITYDDGASWIKLNSPAVGQFYTVTVDHTQPYRVYGGLQDNGVWRGPHNASQNSQWHQTGKYPWESILGGDGMQVQVDNRNDSIIYTGFQFGNYFRINTQTGRRTYIQPKHELGEHPYRFNWQTPILLSSHNQDILYLGGNKLHRSLDRGATWETISGDLTQGGKKGNVAYGTLTTISESPFKFGLLYVGSDDGLVQLTHNGGGNWTTISKTFPKDLWVSRVVASKHKQSRVYVSLNGYRRDDFSSYLYVSEDYGNTWSAIGGKIPGAPINVIAEDPENEDLLFVGTDNGLYASLDRGQNWHLMQSGMPNVAVHDLAIHPSENDLLIGTHGRSIYKAQIAPLQQMNQSVQDSALVVFLPDPIRYSRRWGQKNDFDTTAFEPKSKFLFYVKQAGTYTVDILSSDGVVVYSDSHDALPGINTYSYGLSFSKKGKSAYLSQNKRKLEAADNGKTYLPKGSYTVRVSGNGNQVEKPFEIK